MAIPFRDAGEEESPGSAGFLKFLPEVSGDTWLGALFLMNARGEPVEFTHARLRAPSSFLWRPEDLRLHCLRSVCCAVFDACPTTPLLVLCLAGEVSPYLFSEHVRVEMPVGRLAQTDSVANLSPSETTECAPANDGHSELAVYWTDAPMPDSPARRLFDLLSSRGLLIEPFERAEAGLGEVYTDLFAR